MKNHVVLNLLLSLVMMIAFHHAARAASPAASSGAAPVPPIGSGPAPEPETQATEKLKTVQQKSDDVNSTPYPDSPIIADKMLLGEIKKACPIIVNTQSHGDIRLTHDESFEPANRRGSDRVRGGWTIKKRKLVVTWTQSGETETFNIKRASATDFTFSH